MKKVASIVFSGLLLLSAGAWAKSDQQLLSEARQNTVKVEQVKDLKDETAVSLTGTLVKHLNQDHYEFNDGTGLILLDIDKDLWTVAAIQAGDQVHVLGEVDTHSYKPTNIDVFYIEKLPATEQKAAVAENK